MLNRQNTHANTVVGKNSPASDSPKSFEYSLMPILKKAVLLHPLQALADRKELSFKRIEAELKKAFNQQQLLMAIRIDTLYRNEPLSYRYPFEDAVAYLSVIKVYSKLILDHYDIPEFTVFRNHNQGDYRDVYVSAVSTMLEIYQQEMQTRFDGCLAKHTQNDRNQQSAFSYQRNSNTIYADYQRVESLYESASQVLAEIAQMQPFYLLEYRILRIRIESLIHRSQLLTKNVKDRASDAVRSYERIRAISAHLGNEATPIEILNVRARIALHVEKKIDRALILANEIDEVISGYALNLDFNEQQLGTWVNHNALLKLSIHLKSIDSSRPMMMSSLTTLVKDALSAKETIGWANETQKAQFFAVVDKLLTYTVGTTVIMASTSKLNELKDCRLFFGYIDELFEAYEVSLPRTSYIISAHSIETHKATIDKVKRLVDEKINRLVKAAEIDKANYDALQRKIAIYDAEFESTLAEFERGAKARVLAKPLVLKSKPKSQVAPSTNSEVMTSTHAELEQAEIKSVAQKAEDYFSTHHTLEAIEFFINEVSSQDHAEALLYMGHRYLKHLNIGSAITCFERALAEVPKLMLKNEELLVCIRWSLEEAKPILAEQIEYGNIYLEKAKSERRRFIVSLGLRASMGDHPDKKWDLSDERDQESLYALGLKIFKQIGEEKRHQQLPVSEKTERMRNIKARLAVFKLNQSKVEMLISQTEAALGKPAFPSLSESQAGLFTQPSCKVVKRVPQPGVKQRRKRR